jgi:Major capsid protein N-terminus
MAATQANSLTRISSGLQDQRLVAPKGNPDVAQFVKVMRSTSRWAAQWRRVDFDGAVGFGKRVSLTIPRIAELVNGVMLVVQMPDIYTAQAAARAAAAAAGLTFLGPEYTWTNSLGHALIDTVELEIGGAIVDTLDGRLLEVLDELYEPVDTLRAKNSMIARAASGFGPTTWTGAAGAPVTVYVPIPFWFSRPGRMSHALPIAAMYAERVRIHVNLRPVEQLYYTDARMDPRTVGFRPTVDVAGAMPAIQGGRFWVQDPAAPGTVYTINADMPPVAGVKGRLLDGYTMPQTLTVDDAYMLLEYVSVEEPEAVALRTAELTYFVEQHVAVQTVASQGTREVRIPLPLTNPTKEILWVSQRPDVATYNAWFLFTRELGHRPTTIGAPNVPDAYVQPGGTGPSPCLVPWWPDAVLQPLEVNDWRILPAFRSANSEPVSGALVFYNSYERVEDSTGSLFRSVLPSLKATKAAVHDRYIYFWPFGEGDTQRKGGVEGMYEPRGAANWDKLPRKEMFLTMAYGRDCRTLPDMNIYVWTTAWNVLKVFGGRAGLLFTN